MTQVGALVCAGISGGKIVLWHYLPTKWNAKETVELYEGPIKSALVKHRGVKRTYSLCEDNDPVGYKSKKGVAAKGALGIRTFQTPRYSPDLTPLDFSLWEEIERRAPQCPRRKTSRLHRTRLAGARPRCDYLRRWCARPSQT